MEEYDLVVIGSGPAGEKAAVKAAYFGYRVAIIEKEKLCGGAMVVTGTLPSKTLRETSLYFSGVDDKGLYGIDRNLGREVTINDFLFRKNFVTRTESLSVENNLNSHRVHTYRGIGSFIDPHTIKVSSSTKEETIRAKHVVIATGSYPIHPSEIPFDQKRIHDSDSILEIRQIPKSLCIVGAGVIGCEYATIFSTMESKVSLINNSFEILPFIDQEISNELIGQMQASGVSFYFNNAVKSMQVPESDQEPIEIFLVNGEIIAVDMFLFAAGRSGNIQHLNCEAAGIQTGNRETVLVDETYRTNVKHIYAVGDVIGFPALASTSMDQGRVAVAHIFQTKDLENLPSCFPFGIYTIPEVSMVGMTEDAAKEKGVNYSIGKAYYANTARGKILGENSGFLKLVFERETTRVIGVNIIGKIATEIIHYGLALVEDERTLYDVIGTVFNFPTLHDLYKYAAYDGLSSLNGRKIKI